MFECAKWSRGTVNCWASWSCKYWSLCWAGKLFGKLRPGGKDRCSLWNLPMSNRSTHVLVSMHMRLRRTKHWTRCWDKRKCFSQLKTDQSFHSLADPEHYQGTSTLTELPLDCISNVPLDLMHLVYLGVEQKLVDFWLSGPLKVRLGPENRKEMS